MLQLVLIRPTLPALVAIALAACTAAPSATPSPSVAAATSTRAQTAAPAASAAAGIPAIPVPVAVSLDSKTTVLAVLDIINPICSTRPACVDSLPAIAALLKKAHEAKVPVVYTTTAATNPIVPQIAPAADEPTVVPSVADKFFNTNFDDLLKQRKATTILIVGTRSNGAVLYTAYEANVRGYTVVVAVDGISGAVPFETTLTQFQLLNQPGFTNADNKPLAEKLITLSRGDLITFK